MLNREQFLAKDDVPTRDVDVPEWGDTVRVRMLSAGGRLAWARAAADAAEGKPGPNPIAVLVALGAVGDDGKPLFHVQDTDAIAEQRGDVINRLADAVLELSGMTAESAASAEGNSEATPSGDSLSDSPVTSEEPSQN